MGSPAEPSSGILLHAEKPCASVPSAICISSPKPLLHHLMGYQPLRSSVALACLRP